MANGDHDEPKECDHDWELTYRDGPLSRNDWACTRCGKLTTTFGPSKRNKPDTRKTK